MRPEHAHRRYRLITRIKHALLWPLKAIGRYYRKGWRQKIVVWICALLVLWVGSMYGIAQWYISTNRDRPLVLGASFIPAYAESLGLDAKQTMDAMVSDLGIRHFRLVSYWNQLEPVQGQYDFSLLDWQFEKAEAAGAKVTLSLGLRQPRWPECHAPDWARQLPSGNANGTWQNQLEQYIEEVVNRYKGSPSLESYQLENEFFLEGFGKGCEEFGFDRDRLVREYALIKRLDYTHPIITSRSNNIPSWMVGQPRPDIVGMSVYRRVWDGNITNRYFTYPMPAWYYASLAGVQKILTGQHSMIHEMQAEAWPPHSQSIQDTTLEEQNKSLDSEQLADRFKFSEATGMREVYLWGAEYWYYRKIKLNDPSLWNVAKQSFDSQRRVN